MFEYEWGNPSAVMLSGNEATQDSDQSRQIFDHYTQDFNENLVNSSGFPQSQLHFHQPLFHHHGQTQTHLRSNFYDPRVFASSSYAPPSPAAMLSLEPLSGGAAAGPAGFVVVPKSEPSGGVIDFASRIGLNLGGRTYFSSEEDDFVNRIYRRTRPVEPGLVNSPRCQAEGCNADLTHAKHYHRRHKVCEFHSKAATVIAGGLTQRFCQQCSRFHLLSEFDNGKRSCRKRLADHNRRRRKSHPQPSQGPKFHLENARFPSSENHARSPPESGAQSSSSVTVAISPPRISLECFRQRSYQAPTTSSPPTSSLFSPMGNFLEEFHKQIPTSMENG